MDTSIYEDNTNIYSNSTYSDSEFSRKVRINDVILHSLLGIGSFGSVYLVELKNNLNQYYAMKVLEKSKMKSTLKISKK